ncbi:hypothetical protein GCM10008026_06930 [Chelatococcus composti]|nr:hypothetical protein GCM10008026_06930 [Chelatococcus composti]
MIIMAARQATFQLARISNTPFTKPAHPHHGAKIVNEIAKRMRNVARCCWRAPAGRGGTLSEGGGRNAGQACAVAAASSSLSRARRGSPQAMKGPLAKPSVASP